jgi:hypothetical protein
VVLGPAVVLGAAVVVVPPLPHAIAVKATTTSNTKRPANMYRFFFIPLLPLFLCELRVLSRPLPA